MALPFLLLALVVAFYLNQTAAPSGEHDLNHKEFANEIKAIQQAITRKKVHIKKDCNLLL